MGRVRARISAVGSFSGDSRVSRIATNRASPTPTPSAVSDCFSSFQSSSAREKPRATIGPIIGDTSMAPITTAGDDSIRPKAAMAAEITVIIR